MGRTTERVICQVKSSATTLSTAATAVFTYTGLLSTALSTTECQLTLWLIPVQVFRRRSLRTPPAAATPWSVFVMGPPSSGPTGPYVPFAITEPVSLPAPIGLGWNLYLALSQVGGGVGCSVAPSSLFSSPAVLMGHP